MSLQEEINRILGLFDSVSSVFAILTGIALLLIFLYFFLGTTEYIRKEQGLEEIKKKILWGIIGITVVTSVWGMIHFLRTSILGSHNNSNAVDIETITF